MTLTPATNLGPESEFSICEEEGKGGCTRVSGGEIHMIGGNKAQGARLVGPVAGAGRGVLYWGLVAFACRLVPW